ncbi:adenine deaminase [Pollutibacter soli]|uniref:adenine deaminase n=1 Tax=Pollutibacter soli TaxID=3034157 RepID=UPI003013979B
MNTQLIDGNLVDCSNRTIVPARLHFKDGLISAVEKLPHINQEHLPFLLPGFIDSHIHIESSMLVPSEFARLAVVHGTIATVSDPHEIANVCGIEGVRFMIENSRLTPFKFYFGAPSCVPATTFETAGATLDATAVEQLLDLPEIKYLSEMMNFPGALQGDPEVLKKIEAARKRGKPVDGHAPGLRGEDAMHYIYRGISTDHECFTEEEALDKLKYGMKILIREGSAAKNFEALIDLLKTHPDSIMFCSDDKHPDSLVDGHINQMCARAIAKGHDLFDVIRAACLNPREHYKLDTGKLNVGDPADFILVNDLKNFEVRETWINGVCVASEGKSLIDIARTSHPRVNSFHCSKKQPADFEFISTTGNEYKFPIIEALDGQIVTGKSEGQPLLHEGKWISNVDEDILKIVVVNRYHEAPIAKAFIKNFGLIKGAIASSVAHDSHNIVAVGTDDDFICKAVNLIIGDEGGISCVNNENEWFLPLPVAGLMSFEDGYLVAKKYTEIDEAAKSTGSKLGAPFMTLSFMALLVIPKLKLSDKGLFDGESFRIIEPV